MKQDTNPTDSDETSTQQSTPSKSVPSDQETKKYCRNAKNRKRPLRDPNFWLLLGAFIAAVGAAYYTRQQWLTADDTEKRQLRAYVSIEPTGIQWIEGRPIEISYRAHNFGLTPASNLKMFSMVAPLQYPLPRGIKSGPLTEDPETSTAVAFPAVDLFGKKSTDGPLSQEISSAVRAGTNVRLYFVGIVTYKDVFDCFHETRTVSAIGGADLAEAIQLAGVRGTANGQLFTRAPGYDYAK